MFPQSSFLYKIHVRIVGEEVPLKWYLHFHGDWPYTPVCCRLPEVSIVGHVTYAGQMRSAEHKTNCRILRVSHILFCDRCFTDIISLAPLNKTSVVHLKSGAQRDSVIHPRPLTATKGRSQKSNQSSLTPQLHATCQTRLCHTNPPRLVGARVLAWQLRPW